MKGKAISLAPEKIIQNGAKQKKGFALVLYPFSLRECLYMLIIGISLFIEGFEEEYSR